MMEALETENSKLHELANRMSQSLENVLRWYKTKNGLDALPRQLLKLVDPLILSENYDNPALQPDKVLSFENMNPDPQVLPDFHGLPSSLHEDEDSFSDGLDTCQDSPSLVKIDEFNDHQIVEPQLLINCARCTSEFPSTVELSKHSLIHFKLFITRCSVPAKVTIATKPKKLSVVGPTPPFKCEICNKEFKTIYNCRTHVKLQHADPDQIELFRCDVCGTTFKHKVNLKTHMELHDPKTHLCSICGKTFATKVYLERHVSYVHVGERNHKCPYCPKAFKDAWKLNHHRKLHLGEARQCPHCGIMKGPNNIQSHIESVHKGKRLQCNLCKKLLQNSTKVRDHFLMEHTEETISSSSSISDFVTVIYLDADQLSKVQRRPVPENVGHQGIPDKSPEQNSENQTSNSNQGFKCKICAKEVPTKKTLERHYQYHKKGRDQGESLTTSCPICKQEINTLGLRYHIQTVHSEDVPFKCNLGAKGFLSQKTLRRHYQYHKETVKAETQPKESKCPICNTYIPNLVLHMRSTHPANLDYNCEICKMGFMSQFSLRAHSHCHKPGFKKSNRKQKSTLSAAPPKPAKEPLFLCTLCDVSFFQTGEWKIHQSLHKKDPEYRYKSRKRLRRVHEASMPMPISDSSS